VHASQVSGHDARGRRGGALATPVVDGEVELRVAHPFDHMRAIGENVPGEERT